MRLLAVPLMLGAGALFAVQSQINGRLAAEIGSGMRAGILAAVVSFGTGPLVLVAATALMARQRRQFRALMVAIRDRTFS